MTILVSSHISLSMTRQGGFEKGSNVTEQFHIDAITNKIKQNMDNIPECTINSPNRRLI